jgi:hypothetical protein
MDARPAHQPEAHRQGADAGEDHRQRHLARMAANRKERCDGARHQQQRQERVDSPHGAHQRSAVAQSWQHRGRVAIEHVRVVELCGQPAEDGDKRERSDDEAEATQSDDIAHGHQASFPINA